MLFAVQLADKKWGVIGIKYRKVDCGHQPWNRAYPDSVSKGDFPPVWKAQQRKDNLDW
jgi:hypothetical protein